MKLPRSGCASYGYRRFSNKVRRCIILINNYFAYEDRQVWRVPGIGLEIDANIDSFHPKTTLLPDLCVMLEFLSSSCEERVRDINYMPPVKNPSMP